MIEHNQKSVDTWSWIIQVEGFVMSATFNVAHWILADVYRKTQKNVKHHFSGTKETQKEAEPDKRVSVIGIIINTLFPLLTSVFCGFWSVNAKKWLAIVFNILNICTNVILLVSGILLLRTTKRIQQLFKDHQKIGTIDIKMLRLHAITFGLFSIGLIVYIIS